MALLQIFWKIRKVNVCAKDVFLLCLIKYIMSCKRSYKLYGNILSVTNNEHVCSYVMFNLAALELLKEAIAKAGYTDEVVIGMDVAASEFYRDGKYDLDFKSPDDPSRYITPDELADLYMSFVKDYPGKILKLSVFCK